MEKERKILLKTPNTSSGPSANLHRQLKDKAKHTAALIQEITEELQAIEEESVMEEQDSDTTQISNLEQEDSDIPLTEDEHDTSFFYITIIALLKVKFLYV